MRSTILMASTSFLILSIPLPTQGNDGRWGILTRLADRYAGQEIHQGAQAYSAGFASGHSHGYTQNYDYGYGQHDYGYDYEEMTPPPAVEASAYYSAPVDYTTTADYSAPAEQGGDPYGFLAILNNYRASMGLSPVSLDSNLSAWASQNNAAQSRRGIGHHVNPNCLQNCGWNYGDAASVFQGWMNSPGHRQNMLSPNIQSVGIAYGPGPYWTMNAR